MLDVLVVAPHPDDAELGMAGAIMRFRAEGLRVGILDLTTGEPTPRGTSELRVKETAAATQIRGIEWRQNLGLTNRRLEATLEARAALAGVFRTVRPRWIFAPYWVDAHPDHTAATNLIEAARFWSKLTKTDLPGEPFHPQKIFYYYCVHLKQALQPAFLLEDTPDWERKQAALQCFQSQFVTGRDPALPTVIDRMRDEAVFWGHAIGVKYAEPFASREPLGLGSMRDLL